MELGTGIVMLGEYQEITPYSRIVFFFGWEGDEVVAPGSITAEITLAQEGTDTVVRLRHSGLPSAEPAANHGRGWDYYLARLAIAGAGGDPGPRTLGGGPWRQPRYRAAIVTRIRERSNKAKKPRSSEFVERRVGAPQLPAYLPSMP